MDRKKIVLSEVETLETVETIHSPCFCGAVMICDHTDNAVQILFRHCGSRRETQAVLEEFF